MGYRTGLENIATWLNKPRVRNPDTVVENRSRFLTVSMAPWLQQVGYASIVY
jgi:hypothetical protein